ncbi:unnamed protein product, partial [Effrenium voratum]
MAAGAVRRFGLLFCAAAVCLLWQWQLLAAPAATLTVPLECEFDAAILSNGHMFTKQADVLRSHPWKTNGSVAVFWHIGPGLHAAQVVWEQFHLLQQTLWRLRRVVQSEPKVYAALQEAGWASRTSFWLARRFSEMPNSFVELGPALGQVNAPAYESGTQEHLWRYCQGEQSDLVLYLHTKSAPVWRRIMQHFLLTRAEDVLCNLDHGWDTAGPLFQNHVGWPHYRGNFFGARCEHVRKLPMPVMEPPSDSNIPGYVHGTGRFAAEAWLLRTAPEASRPSYARNCFGVPANRTGMPLAKCEHLEVDTGSLAMKKEMNWVQLLTDQRVSCRCTQPGLLSDAQKKERVGG